MEFATWLGLREPADAEARASELLEPLRARRSDGRLVVHDLGAGTGSMRRWLSPRLPGPQRWVLHDRDPVLLDLVEGERAGSDRERATVSVRRTELAQLRAADLDGAGLITASALLDLLTFDELENMLAACLTIGCPVLLTMSVTGRVKLSPSDELDPVITAAFNDHQRRTVDGRRLLGPDAPAAVQAVLTQAGVPFRIRRSPWRLGPDRTELTAEWLDGWLDAAVEERPELAGELARYSRRRRGDLIEGILRVSVDHEDVLVGCA
jgi:hypothetical protein